MAPECVKAVLNINYRIYTITILFILCFVNNSVKSWDTEDYELFDLVEEVNKTFYEVLGLEKTASSSEIRRQYYKLSLKVHPDHNKDPNAEQQFRQLVSVAEVLRDEKKREKYNNILENGLPDWKHAIFYYRKVRKFGLLELSAILFAIITVGQYVVSWAMYLERKYEMEEVLFLKFKKRDRKSKKYKQVTDDVAKELFCEEMLSQLQKPRFLDLLPFALVRGTISIIVSIPHGCSLLRQKLDTWRSHPISTDSTEQDSDGMSEERIRKPRRKRIYEIPTFSSECILESVDDPLLNGASNMCISETKESQIQDNHLRNWTEEDVAALTKAMGKFPSGVPGRWEKIADHLSRPLHDVTAMTKTLKNTTATRPVPVSLQGLTANKLSQNSVDVDELTEREPEEKADDIVLLQNNRNIKKGCDRFDRTKEYQTTAEFPKEDLTSVQPTTHGEDDNLDDPWSQVQQKALELALSHFPRGTEERWDKIAKCVPEKSMEECMMRYKRLVELVKKKRHTGTTDK